MGEEEHLQLVAHQMENIRNGLRSIIYFRLLSRLTNRDQHFWTATKNAHLGNFALSWAKSFGAFREQLHWRHSIPKPNKERFRQELYQGLGTDQHKFRIYLKSMLALRNELVAHRDLTGEMVFIPDCSMVIEAMKVLYRKLQSMLLDYRGFLVRDNGPGCIQTWCDNVEEEASNYLNAAVSATQEIVEYH